MSDEIPGTWSACCSRLMLGTVQFGMPYGIANRTGQPCYREIVDILATAMEGGVNCLDTAAGYGTSEELIGRALKELALQQSFVVVTKILPLTDDQRADPALAREAIESSVFRSLQRLQLDVLPVVLFHRESDARYLDVLASLQERGLLRHFGVSCDNTPGPAESFLAAGSTALQIPANIVDRRHERSGILTAASRAGAAVFLRSVYLQGLLTMADWDIPESLRAILPFRTRLQEIASDFGLKISDLALRYCLSLPGVTSVITGVESVVQMKDNLRIAAADRLDDLLLAQVRQMTMDLPEMIVTPSLWKR